MAPVQVQRVELSPVPPTASPPSLRKAVATTPARSQFSAKDPSAGLTPPAAAANRAKKPTAAAAPPLTRTPSNASAKADRQPQTPLRTSPPAVVATAAGVKVGSPAVNGRGGSTASPASPRRNLTAAAVASPGLPKKAAAGTGAAGKAAPPASNPGPTKPAYTSTPKAQVTVAGTPSAVASADSDLLHDATRSGVNNNTAATMHNGDHNGVSSLSDVTPPPMSSLMQDVPPRQVFVESEALAVVSPSSPRAGSLGSSVESVVSSTSEQQVSLEEREDALLTVEEEEEQLISLGQRQQRRSSSSRLSLVSSGERKISEKTTFVELVTTETTEDETDFRQKTREIQQEIPLVEGRKSSMTNGGSNYWATQALNNANTASIYQVYNKKVQKTVFSHRECQTFTAQFLGLSLSSQTQNKKAKK